MNDYENAQLQALFNNFKADPFHRLNVKIRRWRSEQLRQLLADPETITLDFFNKQVWRFLTQARIDGEPFDLQDFMNKRSASPEEFTTVENALNEGRLVVEGNFIWGSGSVVYGAPLSLDADAKLEQIRTALHILNQEQVPPGFKAQQLMALSGFGRNIVTGLVMVFHPRDFAIYNEQTQNAVAKLGLPAKTLETFEQSVQQLRQLLGAEDYLELDWFLYLINQGQIQWPVVPPVTNATRFWKISPDQNAARWEEWKENGYIAIGWSDMGDATSTTRREFDLRQQEIIAHPEKYINAHRYTPESVKQLWQFAREIRPGDRIVANRGTTQVLGVGVVTGPCTFHPDADLFLHQIPVQWTDLIPKTVQQGGWRSTLIELTREKFDAIMNQATNNLEVNTAIEEEAMEIPLKAYPLNQILYGPPGTGKTYNSIERAVEIIDGEVPKPRAELVKRYEELRAAGRIGFVTFHQSFTYEEFIEGLRPVLDSDADGVARYEIRDGVFKEMALKALASSLDLPLPRGSNEPTFDELWDELLERIQEDREYKIPGLRASEYRLSLSTNGNILGETLHGSAKAPYYASRKNVQKVWSNLSSNIEPSSTTVTAILQKGSHHFLIAPLVKELRRIAQNDSKALRQESAERTIGVNDARDWLAGDSDLQIGSAKDRYVLIIDEINRGNIAKIFGELITLLETDKRLGGQNELRVTLPYSRDTFAVPTNLYLLGTMNTADKSLALLDLALRRRFKFREYAPDFKCCQKLPEEARKALLQLNHRIVLSKDRDHRIGHSFFVNVLSPEEFNTVFREEIIPLLQEYFYNDWEGLRFVLGEEGPEGRFIRELKPQYKSAGARNRWQWYFDEKEDSGFDCLTTLTANYFPKEPAPATTENA